MDRFGVVCLLGFFLLGASGCATVGPWIWGEPEPEEPEVVEEPEPEPEVEEEPEEPEKEPEPRADEESAEEELNDEPEPAPEEDPEPEVEQVEEDVHEEEEAQEESEPEEEFQLGEYRESSGTLISSEEIELEYGTHALLERDNDEILYVLRSDRVDLNQYIGETVWVRGRSIEGYPPNGGPWYLQVESVTPLS